MEINRISYHEVPDVSISLARHGASHHSLYNTQANCTLLYYTQHIDYSLYQVMPMAVTVDVLLAVSVTSTKSSSSSPRIRISNIHSAKFPSREFGIPADGLIDIDSKSHEWSNYFKAGLKGAAQLLQKKGKQVVMPSMDVMMDGTVPAGGGLSSSAAFVCASALAVMRASGEISVDKTELVELAVVSERAVGVNSGG